MNKLSDEILNKFLDNELDQATFKIVKDQLETSIEDRKRLKALQAVHKELLQMKESKLGDDFTTKLMKRIAQRSKAKKEQKVFIFSISAFILALCLAAVVYVVYLIISAPTTGSGSNQIVENAVNTFQNLTDPIKNLLSGKNISIIGSVLSFGFLLSIYFVIDTLKHVKHNITKSH